jgi:protein-arginine kinase activator protein McsA
MEKLKFCRNCGDKIEEVAYCFLFCNINCYYNFKSRIEQKAFIKNGILKYPELLEDVNKLNSLNNKKLSEIEINNILSSLSETSKYIYASKKYTISML